MSLGPSKPARPLKLVIWVPRVPEGHALSERAGGASLAGQLWGLSDFSSVMCLAQAGPEGPEPGCLVEGTRVCECTELGRERLGAASLGATRGHTALTAA